MNWQLANGVQRAISAALVWIWLHPSRTRCGILDPKTTNRTFTGLTDRVLEFEEALTR